MIQLRNLSSFKGKRIILVTHSGCDVDAICAAASLLFGLRKKNKAKLLVPDHISLPAKNIAKKLQIPYSVVSGQSLEKADCLFLIDFNDLNMAGSLKEEVKRFKGELFLLDHHQPAGKKIAGKKNSLVNPKAVASCSLVFGWLKESGIGIDKRMAACIAAGLVTDSAFFIAANSRTFSIMAETLKKSGKTLPQIISLFSVKTSFDEKIARLKAAKRSRIFLISNYIAVTADVGAFEAEAASALVRIGADIAFVGDSEEGRLRISARASQGLRQKTGFDLAKNVFQKMPACFKGSGGGHAAAAGFNGKGKDINAALQKCIDLTKAFFQKRKRYMFKEYT